MRRTSQKWYNMQQIDMSNEKPMGIAAKVPHVRYSAAYPTGRERIVFRRKERKGRKDLNHEIHEMVITV